MFVRHIAVALLAGCAVAAQTAGVDQGSVAQRAMRLTRDSVWTRAYALPVRFKTHHPQGMVRIGDTFFVSSVEIRTRTTRYDAPIGGYDRTVGDGVGHLFKFDATGNLLANLTLGEGTIYHPGGIDFDGTSIWVSVAEYRPNSRSIIYRVNPETMKATEVFRVADHIGAIVHNTDDHVLHGASWGSRRLYRWPLDRAGRRTAASPAPLANPSHYVDYQDCKYAGQRLMLCSGVTELRQTPDAPGFRLGGLDLIDLRAGRPIHQVPVLLWTTSGIAMTQNPVWIETTATGLRGYFMPEDDASTIYIYDVPVR